LEHEQKGDSDQDDGDESEDSDSGDGGPPENLDISQDDKILTNEDEFSDVEEDVLNLIDEMVDSHISEHKHDVNVKHDRCHYLTFNTKSCRFGIS
jgi:ribosomal protein S15P/S13E